nr:MAG TPA: hypothetical protein [Bacteriophage sp.]
MKLVHMVSGSSITPKNPDMIPFLTACSRRSTFAGTTERRHPKLQSWLVIRKRPRHRKVSKLISLFEVIL